MGLIIKKIEISGDKGRETVSALFDTGSSASLIRKDIVNRVSTALKLPKSIEFELGDGRKMETSEVCVLIIGINGREIIDNVLISERLSEEMIIGAKTMQEWKIRLDPETEEITVGKDIKKMKLVKGLSSLK